MDVTKPCELIGFGAMDVTKPYEFIGFGAMYVTKQYGFIGFGAFKPIGISKYRNLDWGTKFCLI
jgi:hypothetical protein